MRRATTKIAVHHVEGVSFNDVLDKAFKGGLICGGIGISCTCEGFSAFTEPLKYRFTAFQDLVFIGSSQSGNIFLKE